MKEYLEVNADGLAISGVWTYDPINAIPATHSGIEISGEATVGWTWDGTDWVAPVGFVAATPPTVSVDELRVTRDELLRSSDFTQLADAPYTVAEKALWVTYREELRDLPDGYTPVADPVYPTKP